MMVLSPGMMNKTFLLLMTWICSVGMACSFQGQPTSQPSVEERVSQYLVSSRASYEQAKTIWQGVIEAETPVSCGVQINVPASLVLSTSELNQNPKTVIVRDEINRAIDDLGQLSALWELECAQSRTTVPIHELRHIQTLLTSAQIHLTSAELAWQAWQT
jgi:hypothetical protein